MSPSPGARKESAKSFDVLADETKLEVEILHDNKACLKVGGDGTKGKKGR